MKAKRIIIIMLIYLSGCFVGYIEGKRLNMRWNREFQKHHPFIKILEWSVRDRNFSLIICSLSWFDVAAIEIIQLYQWLLSELNDRNKANW